MGTVTVDPNKELEALQLEETRYRVQQLRNIQQNRETRRKAIEDALRDEQKDMETAQSACWHKKGGMGTENLLRGNDALYAVVKHILPHGVMIVVCQRCAKLWAPPDPALASRGATVEERKLYARLLTEYREAVAYPTDNTTSGSQLYVITDNRVAA